MLFEAPLHGVRDRMLALRAMPAYAGLRDESLLFIAEYARERRFRTGDQIHAENAPVDHIYFLIHGRVELSRGGKVAQVIDAPGAVGVLSALARDPNGRRALATTDILALEIPATAFLANLEEDFGLLRNSLRVLAGKALESRGNLPINPARAPAAETGPLPDHVPTLCERIIGLRSGGPFVNANMDAVFEIARRMHFKRFEPGELLFDLGEPSTCSIRINYGRVRCTSKQGEHVDVGYTNVLGALDGWAGRPRSYSARAETRVDSFVTGLEDFLSVLEMHPALALGMLKSIATSLLGG